jgi:hypothetical protein
MKIVCMLLNVNEEAKAELRKVDQYDFDVFKLRSLTNGNELVTLLTYLVAKRGLLGSTEVELPKLVNFARRLQKGYKNITYHNKSHAADLCQTFNYYTTTGGLRDSAKMDNIEILACLTSACMHDFEHPGVNNQFLVNMVDEKALRYNDISVLENHHIAASFELMFQDD